jgi:hypothetical protein
MLNKDGDVIDIDEFIKTSTAGCEAAWEKMLADFEKKMKTKPPEGKLLLVLKGCFMAGWQEATVFETNRFTNLFEDIVKDMQKDIEKML